MSRPLSSDSAEVVAARQTIEEWSRRWPAANKAIAPFECWKDLIYSMAARIGAEARREQIEKDAGIADVMEQLAREAAAMHEKRGDIQGSETAAFFWSRAKAFQATAAAIRAQAQGQ